MVKVKYFGQLAVLTEEWSSAYNFYLITGGVLQDASADRAAETRVMRLAIASMHPY
jgi:hypothetical protein